MRYPLLVTQIMRNKGRKKLCLREGVKHNFIHHIRDLSSKCFLTIEMFPFKLGHKFNFHKTIKLVIPHGESAAKLNTLKMELLD